MIIQGGTTILPPAFIGFLAALATTIGSAEHAGSVPRSTSSVSR